MNLRSLDLNLLVILDALLDEAHVSRAAARLALSQPATSSALERCRSLFNDRLLERRGATMQLTAKAEALRDPLKRALAALSGVIDTPETDVRQIERTVRVAMADIPASLLAVPLLNTLQRTAPGITLALLPWMSANEALHGLEKARMDLAVAVIPDVSGKLRRELLIQGSFVIAMRAAHPAAKQFSLDSWLVLLC